MRSYRFAPGSHSLEPVNPPMPKYIRVLDIHPSHQLQSTTMLHSRISTIKGDFDVEYYDADDFSHLPPAQCAQAYGICYVGNQIVLCRTANGTYILPGGTVEPGETLEQTLIREVQEESNMQVIKSLPIGYQKVFLPNQDPIYQVRYVATVKPYGPFVTDPAGHIVAINLVPESDAPHLLNWGDIGQQLFIRAKQKRDLLQLNNQSSKNSHI